MIPFFRIEPSQREQLEGADCGAAHSDLLARRIVPDCHVRRELIAGLGCSRKSVLAGSHPDQLGQHALNLILVSINALGQKALGCTESGPGYDSVRVATVAIPDADGCP